MIAGKRCRARAYARYGTPQAHPAGHQVQLARCLPGHRGEHFMGGHVLRGELRHRSQRPPHNALDLGPATGLMLSTYIVEPKRPIATITG
jgi:hypothetical protein